MMRRCTTEWLGTAFLVLCITTTSRTNPALVPLAAGAALMAMVYAGGHISGGHYNPAVTLAVVLRGRLRVGRLPAYVASQVTGAVGGAAAAHVLTGAPPASPLTFAGPQLWHAFVAELLVTTALAYVVLNVATSSDHSDNQFYGLAIGLTVTAGALAVGPVSGGAFNPAVALGLGAFGALSWSALWVYLLAGLLAAVAAAALFRLTSSHEWRRSAGPEGTVPAPRRSEEGGVSTPGHLPAVSSTE